jgi:hypothetical protein
LVAAIAGLCFAIWGESPTRAANLVDRAQTALEWTTAPAEHLDSSASASQVAAARQEIARRRVVASRCLALLAGREAPSAAVVCKPNAPPRWKDTDTATWVTLAAGALTAIFAALGMRLRFAFGAGRQTPDRQQTYAGAPPIGGSGRGDARPPGAVRGGVTL